MSGAVDALPLIHGGLGTDGTLSTSEVTRLFGVTRHAVLGGHLFQANGLGISTAVARDAAEIIAATTGAAPFVRPSMERFWADVKQGNIPEAQQLAKRASYAFAFWIKRFIPGDFEEMTDTAPKVEKPAAGKRKSMYREITD